MIVAIWLGFAAFLILGYAAGVRIGHNEAIKTVDRQLQTGKCRIGYYEYLVKAVIINPKPSRKSQPQMNADKRVTSHGSRDPIGCMEATMGLETEHASREVQQRLEQLEAHLVAHH